MTAAESMEMIRSLVKQLLEAVPEEKIGPLGRIMCVEAVERNMENIQRQSRQL